MARYSILSSFLAVPRHLPVAHADTPAEAVRLARQYAQKGANNIKIGDNDLAEHFPIEEFAAKHGIR